MGTERGGRARTRGEIYNFHLKPRRVIYEYMSTSSCPLHRIALSIVSLSHVPQAGIDYKGLIGTNWVDPPERKRKRLGIYSETDARKVRVRPSRWQGRQMGMCDNSLGCGWVGMRQRALGLGDTGAHIPLLGFRPPHMGSPWGMCVYCFL